jgi:hypothetical protein
MGTRRYTAQKMQVNAAWSSIFQFTVGNPPVPQSLATWTLSGKVQRVNLPNNNLDLTSRMHVGVDTSQLMISLTPVDTDFLGVGRIVFEVLRVSPLPQRPILKFYIDNNEGIATGLQVQPIRSLYV